MPEPTILTTKVEKMVKVAASLTGVEPRVNYGRTYQPVRIEVTYVYDDPARGWRALTSLHGPQIRKDGSTGTREIYDGLLGPRYGGQSIPEWVTAFVERYHPGRAALAGGPSQPTEEPT